MAQPDETGDTHSLLDWIRRRIEEDGPVTMARFMEWALYHPRLGYYSAGRRTGPPGDFTTSPEASRAFGGALIDNEVVDAFPVHVLENREGEIVEQYVDLGYAPELRIVYRPPSRPELTAFLRRYAIELRPGQRLEVSLAANEWIGQV